MRSACKLVLVCLVLGACILGCTQTTTETAQSTPEHLKVKMPNRANKGAPGQ
jgi:hypothetical protein